MHRKIITTLLFVLVFTRLWQLDYPSKHYFDEVYHAFTAQQMLHGNKMAWEWWNTPPAGFAYEWTHPPLAKLGMVLGMKLIGESALGWRLPGAILGILSGILIYAISYKLFSNRTTSLITLFLYTFDGLPLVMSRIGMNDIYIIFFILLALYLILSRRIFLASVALGLALASKWSGLYFIPIYLFFLVRSKKFIYVLIPPLIYLAIYLPFFISGHTVNQFIELQKQMWWYHTRLKATHNYSSPAISWPIMYRPVWAFVEYSQKSTANIYIQGNPIIWWLGLVAVVIATWRRRPVLPLVGYYLFLLPWIISPRIMFIYHYFPSVIFMYMILADLARPLSKPIQIGLGILIVLTWILFSPRFFGISIPSQYLPYLLWFPSWR